MDYQEESNLKIGASGAGKKNYLKMPWSVEDTIENLEELKEMMQQKLIMTNYHGRGEKDAEEIAFDFDRAIQALKENQEYKQLGTLKEVRKAVEKQNAEKPKAYRLESHGVYDGLLYCCPNCGCSIIKQDNRGFLSGPIAKHCLNCGQKLDWMEVEE